MEWRPRLIFGVSQLCQARNKMLPRWKPAPCPPLSRRTTCHRPRPLRLSSHSHSPATLPHQRPVNEEQSDASSGRVVGFAKPGQPSQAARQSSPDWRVELSVTRSRMHQRHKWRQNKVTAATRQRAYQSFMSRGRQLDGSEARKSSWLQTLPKCGECVLDDETWMCFGTAIEQTIAWLEPQITMTRFERIPFFARKRCRIRISMILPFTS